MKEIEAVFHIESQGNDGRAVEESLKKLVEEIKKDDGISVKKADFSELMKNNLFCSQTAEVEAAFNDFRSYLISAVKYGPSAIEVYEPDEIEIEVKEFLKILSEVMALMKLMREKYGFYIEYKEEKAKPKVGLTEDEIDALLSQGAIRAKLVAERDETEKKAVKNFLNVIKRDAFINKVKSTSVEGKTLVAAEIFTYELKSLIKLAVEHLPLILEIVEPEKIVLKTLEIQDIGIELGGFYFDIAHAIKSRKRV